MLNSIQFEECMVIDRSELSPELAEALEACASSGDQTHNVEYVMDNYDISGDPEVCRSLLRGYGAWEEDELQDHHLNLQRLVWISGCDLEEQGEIYHEAY